MYQRSDFLSINLSDPLSNVAALILLCPSEEFRNYKHLRNRLKF